MHTRLFACSLRMRSMPGKTSRTSLPSSVLLLRGMTPRASYQSGNNSCHGFRFS